MNSELDLHRPTAPDTDSWVQVVSQVAELAQNIANTPFVPESFRGSVPAVAAAILTGRELGIPPMISLRHVHVIKGKPGQSAELMRALVLRAGHEFEVVDATDTRAIVRGRRRGSAEWHEARFTADQAKRAQIQLGGYPEDKLVARATTRLCRRLFADVIGGLPAVEELEDGEVRELPEPQAAPTGPAKAPPTRPQAVRRATPVRSVPDQREQPAKTEPPPALEPPLPGEVDAEESSAAEPEQDPERDPNRPITRPQSRMLHTLFGELGVAERDERLRITGVVIDRPVETSNDLTAAEATTLIETLVEIRALPEPHTALATLTGGAA